MLAALDPSAQLALGLAVILVAAKLAGHAALRLGAPAVLGELLVGILLGNVPGPLAALARTPAVDAVARLGVLILVFEVGLELTMREVLEVGIPSVLAALFGTGATFALGWAVSAWMLPGAPREVAVYIGASLTATSIGITARVLKELGQTRAREGRIVVGAAVVDDVIGLVALTVVSGWVLARPAAGAAPASGAQIALIVAKSVAFLALSLAVGAKLAPPVFALAARLRTEGSLVAVGLAFCFALAWAASLVGLAAIIGAFTAGLILEESHSARFVARGERPLAELVAPVSSFVVPVFFVVMGMRTELRAFVQPGAAGFALALTAAAVVGKLACGLGAGRGARRAAVAVGMIPRGEVTLVFASLGAAGARPLLDAKTYASLVVVVVLTTILTPPALKRAFAAKAAAPASASSAAP